MDKFVLKDTHRWFHVEEEEVIFIRERLFLGSVISVSELVLPEL